MLAENEGEGGKLPWYFVSDFLEELLIIGKTE